MNQRKLIKLLESHGFEILTTSSGRTWQGVLRTPPRRGITGALRTVVQWTSSDAKMNLVQSLEAYAYAGPKGRESIVFKVGMSINGHAPVDKITRIIEACMP